MPRVRTMARWPRRLGTDARAADAAARAAAPHEGILAIHLPIDHYSAPVLLRARDSWLRTAQIALRLDAGERESVSAVESLPETAEQREFLLKGRDAQTDGSPDGPRVDPP